MLFFSNFLINFMPKKNERGTTETNIFCGPNIFARNKYGSGSDKIFVTFFFHFTRRYTFISRILFPKTSKRFSALLSHVGLPSKRSLFKSNTIYNHVNTLSCIMEFLSKIQTIIVSKSYIRDLKLTKTQASNVTFVFDCLFRLFCCLRRLHPDANACCCSQLFTQPLST